MVTRFGYAFFAVALLTAIGIIFAGSLKQERHHEVTVTAMPQLASLNGDASC